MYLCNYVICKFHNTTTTTNLFHIFVSLSCDNVDKTKGYGNLKRKKKKKEKERKVGR